ncbi:conserved hypothetical protein [Leishmania infantum JPCM5]|uniref:Endonuclease/exonuclease/phosphatase domain-containing protein n=2 Tax=Leishmania infantum TaxID=5671 RepID=A4I9Z4_LEIIN|nr:conserved hypothetical protein [Leishmania infantum JPCM5]CAM71649.2 conserved hypothetical protein [Leishmania infantum JPCM5]|eukprot:XP_001468563.2 conserved hypothetical protein [Leishmania infantum JPCM5]
MLRQLPLRRFRLFSSSLRATHSTSVDATIPRVRTHRHDAAASTPVTDSTLLKKKPTKAATASPSSAPFLTDYRTEKAQRRWSNASRATQAVESTPSRTGPSHSTASVPSRSSPTSSSAAARPLLKRTMQAKNKVVVLHPEGSQVITLDMSIEVPAPAAGAAAPLQPKRGTTTVSKSMAREEKETAAKTLGRIRLLFAPPRSSGQSSKQMTKDKIFAECPTVRAFCRSSDLAGMAEEDGPLAAPGATSVVLPSLDETALFTELNPELPNRIFWKHARVLCVNETIVCVLYNVPTVVSITSPGIPYVGLPLACADVSLLFASKESLCYEWCVLSEASASTRSANDDDAAFRVVGTAPTFTPTSDLQGKEMMLRVSLDPATGLWTEMRLPSVVRQLPPPVPRWQETTTPVNYPAFRVVTYNILYDDFCTSKSSKAKIYPFATDDILDLENRKVRIVQELLAYHTDIVCLQECGRDVFQSYFLPVMRACGYDGVYCNKSGSVKEGCGFLFRESRFQLVQHASVPLNFQTLSTMFPELAGRVGACPELEEALSAVTSIGARVVLRESTSDKEIVVGNTHLFYHANACHIRVLQAYMLLHWLSDATLISPGGDAATSPSPSLANRARPRRPLVMCGDFNCTHATGAYRLLTTGQVEADHPSWDKGRLFWWGCARLLGYDADDLVELLGKDAKLPHATVARKDCKRPRKTSAETAAPTPADPAEIPAEASNETQAQEDPAQGEGGERVITKVFHEALYGPQVRLQDAYHRTDLSLPWTNFTLTFREVIDYIFFSEDSLEVLRTVPIPSEAELTENFALPNKKYPSDHVALVADLAFTTQ